ncbi:polyprenyl synthetase family protein [Streptomyces albofaciens JCM 4342]|uniref:polyprenyl synthetase family protein n=1 Tax=Streptomyces albofaciens TaxID=66866 RepID=UPI00123869BD|nr:polyprenyl synthetase family protein [Streptomyces albofaciens]KAA6212183.1 polyprenyl synthetase family protein [Streptomyces albofaciens JCM 4342]
MRRIRARDPHDAFGAHAVDADVAGAVGRTLDEVLGERLADATAADALFARDVAERVARFTLGGGKRLRGQFVWWGLRVGGGGDDAAEAALRLAAALELLQTCALVHDDVMDGAELRRGRPALHAEVRAQYGRRTGSGDGGPSAAAFGRSTAILAGDLALAWADDTVLDTRVPGHARSGVHALWRGMRTEMVAGQYLDLHAQVTASRSPARALHTARLKSARYSVERPLLLGAALAGADDRTTGALRAAGRCAGLAFQLHDDLLGVFGDPAETGKPSGDDIREGKLTYLTAVARARAEAAGDHTALGVLDAALGAPDLTAAGLDRVREVLVSTGARAALEDKVALLADRGTAHLADLRTADPSALRSLHGLLRATSGARTAAPVAAHGHGGER